MNSLKKSIAQEFKDSKQFSLFDAYESFPEKPHETVRARIYDGLGIEFERVEKGVYRVVQDDTQCLIIEGDGRDLSFIEDESVDAIITDHPWLDEWSVGFMEWIESLPYSELITGEEKNND